MTKTDCRLPRFGTSQPPLLRVDRLSKLLVAGLVILIVTSEFSFDGTRIRRGAKIVTAAGTATISDSARATASSLFGDRCAVCHGQNGDGKGPGASNLNPKPRDFRDRKWQRSVSDETMAKAIVYGGPAVGLSSAMAANPDLESQPSVVAALIEHIRDLGKKSKH
jgi:cytochrome c553